MSFIINLLFVLIIAVLFFTVLFLYFQGRKLVAVIPLCFLLITGVFLYNFNNVGAFPHFYPEIYDENAEVVSIEIQINDTTKPIREIIDSVLVHDKETMEKILTDLAQMKIKKYKDVRMIDKEFTLIFAVKKEVREKFFVQNNYYIELSGNYVNEYAIISDTNHLDTIEKVIAQMGLE